MSFTVYDASVPVFANALRNMRAWLDKAAAHGTEADLMSASLIADMRPLAAQYQMASDTAKNAVARLAGIEAPAMPDTETSFDGLRARCEATLRFIEGVDRATLADAAERPIVMTFPNGMGYDFTGTSLLTGYALPNFFFHCTTAYAILRAAGTPLGKPDFLRHLGAPNRMP